MSSEKIDYQLHDTRLSKNATHSVRNHFDRTFTDLIIVGGDGTINESINGLDMDVPVSMIPAGTGDDFVKMIDIGKRLDKQIHTAVYGKVKTIDLGSCNNRKFINGVGIGFDGQIVEDMIAKRVPLLKGHAAYYYHVLRILGGYKEKAFHFSINEEKHQKELIILTVGNGSTFGGGFKLMPDAKIDDGLLEICEIGKISGLRRFLNIGRLSKGTHGVLNEVKLYQATHIFVDENPMLFAHIDGERMGRPPFEIKILPKALRIRTASA